MSGTARDFELLVLALQVLYYRITEGGGGAGEQDVIYVNTYRSLSRLAGSVKDADVLGVRGEADPGKKSG